MMYEKLALLAELRNFETVTLGMIGEYPLLLLIPQKPKARKKHILVAAGFHGEEIAGPWGIIKFLEEADGRLLESVNLSLLPLVNPTGFVRNQRMNQWDENPNRGFCHLELPNNPPPSREENIKK